VTRVVNPVADEWSDTYAVYRVYTRRAILTQPLAQFLDYCHTEDLAAILVTDEAATISPALDSALARVGARWAFKEREGNRVFNGVTGQQVFSLQELLEVPEDTRDVFHSYDARDPQFGTAALRFDAYVRHQAVAETRIGYAAEQFIAQLGTGSQSLDTWGGYEPGTQRWSPDALTQTFQGQMPQTMRMHAQGLQEDAAASMNVGRTRQGLLEHVSGVVSLDRAHDGLDRDAITNAGEALRGLSARFQMNAAFVALTDRESDLTRTTRLHSVDLPLAIYLGPRLVRNLGVDFERAQNDFDVEILGSKRVPAALARMSGNEPLWMQFSNMVHSLSQHKLAEALGWEVSGGTTHAS
jgi:hypothetical protein